MPCVSRSCIKATSVEPGAKQQNVKTPVASSELFGSNMGKGAQLALGLIPGAAIVKAVAAKKAAKKKSPDDPDGYTHHNAMGCTGANELGTFKKTSQAECSNKCNENPDCVSFEYKKKGKKCQLSTTCTADGATASTTGWDLFTKEAEDAVMSPWVDGPCSDVCGGGQMTQTRTVVTPPAYGGETGPLEQTVPCNEQPCSIADFYDESVDTACTGRNELGTTPLESREACANACTNNPACVSWEINPSNTKCQFSTTCTSQFTNPATGWKLFTKLPTTKVGSVTLPPA